MRAEAIVDIEGKYGLVYTENSRGTEAFLIADDEKGFVTHTVHPSGFHDDELLTDEPEIVQLVTKIWIEWCITPTNSENKNHSSYNLKHDFQRMTGIYLTNNQFKQAMALCGYFPRCDLAKLNWTYALSSKSACFSSRNKGKFKNIISAYVDAYEQKEKSADGIAVPNSGE